jgi:hypothetical protein
MTQLLTERYHERLAGVLSCYDRIVITGTLPGACYAAGMTSFLNAKGMRIFDYARFAEALRERIRERAQALCAEAGIEIEHIAKSHIRKEEVVAKVELNRAGIEFTLADNALVNIADVARAQALADALKPEQLHRLLDRYAKRCCPILDVFGQRYH